MVDNEQIEGFLIQMGHPPTLLEEGMWRVDDAADGVPPIIVRHDPPIVYVRLKVMDLPPPPHEALFELLLRMNASGIAFGAYAVDNNEVLLVDTLRSESLSLGELQASVESLTMAVTEHYRDLQPLVHSEE